MSYTIRQKIKGKIYLYEVTATWDPIKKNSVQKRTYLGAEGANKGEPLPKKTYAPKTSLDFGNYFLFKSVAKAIGLSQCLEKTMPDEDWEDILNLAIFKLTSSFNFNNYEHWCELNLVKRILHSPDISRVLEKIEQHRIPFIKEWVKLHPEKQAAYFDLTSVSTYTRQIDYAEWGYNRDKEVLPQVNLGIVYAEESQYPLMYSFYSGSISDVKTLTNILEFSHELGIEQVVFILDCGFYSQKNIEEMLTKKLKFIIRMRPDLKVYENLVKQFKLSSTQTFALNKNSYYYKKVITKIGKAKVTAHIYHDNQRYQEELNSFLSSLSEVEECVLSQGIKNPKELEDFLIEQKFNQFFTVMSNGEYTRDEKEINNYTQSLGKFILISADPTPDSKTILENYRKRDCSEKGFCGFKNSIGMHRLRTQTNNTTLGSIFISFIALILYSHATKCLKKSNIYFPAMVASLNTLRAFRYNHSKLTLGELSKKNREIFNLFKILLPKLPCY
jgi:transposase